MALESDDVINKCAQSASQSAQQSQRVNDMTLIRVRRSRLVSLKAVRYVTVNDDDSWKLRVCPDLSTVVADYGARPSKKSPASQTSAHRPKCLCVD